MMAEQKKGLGTLAWVAIGCGVVAVFVVVVLVVGGLFVAHKVKQAGFDSDLWQKNPAVAASKIITTFNPNMEVVKVDEDKGLITVRDKKTGKVVTLNFEDIKNGKFTVQEEGKESVTVQTSKSGGDEGTVTITSDKGKVVVGSGAEKHDLPDWIPVYPGAEVTSTYSGSTDQELSGALSQTTTDSIETVMQKMASILKEQGFAVSTNSFQQDGKTAGGMVAGEDTEHGRTISVMLGAEDGSTTIGITYNEKK